MLSTTSKTNKTMSKSISRFVKILLGLFIAVTVVFLILFYAGDVVEEGTNQEHPVVTEGFIIWAYILLAITLFLTLGFSLFNMVTNPKGAKKSLVGVVGAGVVILIAFFLANDTPLYLPHYTGADNVPATLKMVDTGLFTSYIFAGIAIVAIVVSEVSKAFK